MIRRFWCWLRRHRDPRLMAVNDGLEHWVCRFCNERWTEYNVTGRKLSTST
jgi:hypothetical protein